jgi:hypothetical protein
MNSSGTDLYEDDFMNISKVTVWSPLAILVLLFSTVSLAWAEQVHLKYTGTGWDTTVDNFDDGYPVTMSIGEAKGSPGASRVEITGEWMPWDIAEVTCEGDEVEFKLVFSASVGTFQNRGQLFGFSDFGWMCVDQVTGHYYGIVWGIYQGGAGKFAGATGEWVSDFDGYFLEPPTLPAVIGFRSMTGNVKGHFELPE